MTKIEEKLLLYTELSPAERREVDAYVAGHPEWKAPWEEARAFAALLHRAGTLRQDPPSDEVLAYYVATRRMERHPGPAPLQEVFEWLEARLAEDAGLQQRCNQLEQRMYQIEAAGDFARRFEELTGHTLGPAATPRAPDRPARPAARLHRLIARPLGRMAAVVCLLVLCYGTLFLASELTTSDLTQAALTTDEALEAFGPRLRATFDASDDARADSLYLLGLEALRDSRRSFLGLFPRFDPDRLRQAADYFEAAGELVPRNSYLDLEIQFYLGKIHLARQDTAAAIAAFEQVVEEGGSQSAEARAILEMLHARP